MKTRRNLPEDKPRLIDKLLWEYLGLHEQILALLGHLDPRDLVRYQINSDRLAQLLHRLREVRELYGIKGGTDPRVFGI